jgi:hypothetical protein
MMIAFILSKYCVYLYKVCILALLREVKVDSDDEDHDEGHWYKDC